MGKRAKGRSLADFSPLSAAELEIRAAAALGGMPVIGETRPEAENAECTVRAEFLRFLALGGDDEAPVQEKGLHVQGAWITGKLVLSQAEIAGALTLAKCRFAEAPELVNTQIRGWFSLAGSAVPGLHADGLTCRANVHLKDGFTSTDEVRLPGATVGGDLSCGGGTFENLKGVALNAEGIKVGKNVYLGDNLRAQGAICLGSATIGGDLVCRGGNFCNEGENSTAIHCQGLRVSGGFLFDRVKIRGAVNLTAAHVAHLVDDRDSWPENIILDGFVYDSFAGNAPTTAKDRLAWLDQQSPDHSGKAKNPRAFRPQPWQQLRKVLRDMGHLEDSRQVAIAFENRKRKCRVIGEISAPATPEEIVTCFRQWLQSRTARGFHWLYGCLIGYGYRPIRLLGIVGLVWLVSTVLFDIGGHSRVFGPSDPQIFDNPAYDSCNPEKNPRANWTRCQIFPRAYPAFYPPLYALDVLLPVGKLGQQDHWAPLASARAPSLTAWVLAWATQITVWLETLFGWIAGLLLVATVTGLAKRHDE